MRTWTRCSIREYALYAARADSNAVDTETQFCHSLTIQNKQLNSAANVSKSTEQQYSQTGIRVIRRVFQIQQAVANICKMNE